MSSKGKIHKELELRKKKINSRNLAVKDISP